MEALGDHQGDGERAPSGEGISVERSCWVLFSMFTLEFLKVIISEWSMQSNAGYVIASCAVI